MSTKIHHGHRVDPSVAGDPFTLSVTLRDVLGRTYQDLYARVLAVQATLLLDGARTDPDTSPSSRKAPVHQIDTLIREASGEGGRREPEYDLGARAVLLADPATPTGPYFLLLYTEQGEYVDALRSIPGIEEYAYWNNSDRPAELTDAQWDDRRTTWDRVLGRGIPASQGLSWQLFGPTDQLHPATVRDTLAAHIPPTEARAKHLTRTRVNPFDADALAKGQLHLRDPEDILAERARLTEQILPQLTPVTVDDLFTRLPAT